MRRNFRLPSASTVIASMALLAALGGTSYAAATITGKDIKNNTIRSGDVRNSTLTGKDVKNSSLTSGDIKNGTLLAKDFKTSELPAGPQGPQGPAGASGGLGELTYIFAETGEVPAGDEGQAEAVCPDGLIVTGGGVASSAIADDPPPAGSAVNYAINSSYPSAGDGSGDVGVNAWTAFIENTSGETQDSAVFAICAKATAAGDLVRMKKSAPRSAGR